ncbi:hypothetical protein M3M38_07325 [Fructilactobacillus cliffordii]|uniref:hypothetical protein n=1 Tax=Fructilactobacillus cliffordii TaxID=2940299 RepID=UPI0020939891|nr:hypothetical protein [Fructilactobacillus cliffordii]USS86470.1 hypothetical protein M3M38_07325 [Fructilactobacillus cliffordii]
MTKEQLLCKVCHTPFESISDLGSMHIVKEPHIGGYSLYSGSTYFDSDGCPLGKDDAPIYYCPMCGRRLDDNDEN